jgi:hypothetical protein
MPRLAALVLAALALTLALSASSPAAAVEVENRCGDVVKAGFFDTPQAVKALGVSCRRAKRIATRHWRTSGRNEHCDLAKPSCTIQGWTCRRHFFGNSGTRVRCASGNRRVRWFYGA